MKLVNEVPDTLLTKVSLRLAREYSLRCSCCKTERLHTVCLTCGTGADHRLVCIHDKNVIGEKARCAYYRREWHRGEEDIHYTNGMDPIEAKQRPASWVS